MSMKRTASAESIRLSLKKIQVRRKVDSHTSAASLRFESLTRVMTSKLHVMIGSSKESRNPLAIKMADQAQ